MKKERYAIGFDIGSSSVKAALVEVGSSNTVATTHYPPVEMSIQAVQVGWAEQDPEIWWEAVGQCTQQLLKTSKVSPAQIHSIGLAYQMHGLVLIDKQHQVLRPAIIWCDSRAVDIGNTAFDDLGKAYCLGHLLNSPGNFTASKLKWVQENEPDIYEKIHKILLPGDYIAMRLTGEVMTTISGLSEGIFWDFKENDLAHQLLAYYKIAPSLIPPISPTFGHQGRLTISTAKILGLQAGTPLSYRAGDQANNALSLGVFEPGQVAATGGTSGVVYGISNNLNYDEQSRINGFAHVNHRHDHTRIGQLLCINGAGIQYAWIKNQLNQGKVDYQQMEAASQQIPVGADGLQILPFGNGAERMLNNKQLGAQICNLQFNSHTQAHLYRAALEGIAFSFIYGIHILKEIGIKTEVIKVGNDNLFQSKIFSMTIAHLLHCRIEMYATNGAVGAAKASAYGIKMYESLDEVSGQSKPIKTYLPENTNESYSAAYATWNAQLIKQIL